MLNSLHKPVLQYKQPSSIAFGAGKVYLWFDNDGTYLPYKTDKDLNNAIILLNKDVTLNERFNNFRNFIERAKGSIELNITTGKSITRTLDTLYNLSNKGILYLLPNRIVTNDGEDTFEITSNKEDSRSITYNLPGQIANINNNDPSNTTKYKLNTQKREEIIKKTKWNSGSITKEIKMTFKNAGFNVYEKNLSKMSNNFKYLTKNNKNNNLIFIEKEGDFKIVLKVFTKEKNLKQLKTLIRNITNNLERKNITTSIINMDNQPAKNNYILLKVIPRIQNETISKAYDISNTIQKAEEENDLIIVAGDGNNDAEMINPNSYTHLVSKEKLPLRSIIIDDENKPFSNNKLKKVAKQPGNEKFISFSTPENLLNAVKNAIKNYAQRNPEFKKALHPDIASEINI